jgi:hypothetical protein
MVSSLTCILTSIDIVGGGSSGPLVVVSARDSLSAISSSTLIFGTMVVVPLVWGAFFAGTVVPPARFLPARGFVRAPLSTGTGGTFLAPLEIVGVAGGNAGIPSVSSSASSSLKGVELIRLRLFVGALGTSLRPEDD